jgi:hypothetical protein
LILEPLEQECVNACHAHDLRLAALMSTTTALHHDATTIALDWHELEFMHPNATTPCQGTQNPSVSALIALHVPFLFFPPSVACPGSGLGIKG